MPAPDRAPPIKIVPDATRFAKGIADYYSAVEVDALLADVAVGDVDLSAYATTDYVDATKTEIIAAVTPALAERYTKTEADRLLGSKADQSEFSAFQGQFGTQEAEFREYFRLLNQGFATVVQKGDVDAALALKADAASTYTKPEVDAAIAGVVTGDLSQEQIDAILSQVGPVDLSEYAKLNSVSQEITANKVNAQAITFSKSATTLGYARLPDYPEGKLGIEIGGAGGKVETIAYNSEIAGFAKLDDNTQNVVANAVVAKGYAFGDAASPSNPGLVYTDTNQGYGARLVLDAPAGVEYLVYASDLEQVKSRVEALEGKAAPSLDLSPYITQVDADARYGARTAEAVSLLQGQLQSVFDSVYTRPEADDRYAERAKTYTKTECDGKFLTLVDVNQYAYQADVYTKKQTDDRFMRIDQAFSKVDFDNQMALMLYSRKQIDDRIAAINPIGSPSINDPALADFKQSVLDEVKRLMSGGKTVPDDIDWTVCPSVAGSGTIEARVLNGVIQLRGEVTINISATGSFTQIRRLPANFPKPPDSYHSIVYGIQTGSTYRRVFVRWNTDGGIAICPDGTMTAATLTGATAYAY
jgi:hypothetical protein